MTNEAKRNEDTVEPLVRCAILISDGLPCGEKAIAECCLGPVCVKHGMLAAAAGLKPHKITANDGLEARRKQA